MKINSKYFPPYVRSFYHIDGLITKYGYVYIKFIKVMYGLKQGAIIDYNQLIYRIEPQSYDPLPFTTRL